MQNSNINEFNQVIDNLAADNGTNNDASNQDQTLNQTQQVQNDPPASSNAGQTNNTEQTNDSNGQKDNSTIKQLRDQIKKYKEESETSKTTLDRIAKMQGMSTEDYLAKLQAEEDKRNATAKGITPEVEEQMRLMQSRIKELEETNRAQNFNARANQLINKYGLTEDAFVEFAQNMMNRGFDVRSENMDLDLLYRASNFDTLVAQQKAAERQAVLNEIQQQRNSSNSVGVKTPTNKAQSQATSNDEITRDDIQSFMDALNAE